MKHESTKKPLDLKTLSKDELVEPLKQVLREYLAATENKNLWPRMKTQLEYPVIDLLNYDADNVAEYLDTASKVLAALAGTEAGKALLDELALPYSDNLITIMQRLIYSFMRLLECPATMATIKLAMYDVSGPGDYTEEFLRSEIVLYQNATAALHQLITLNQ